MFNVYGECPHLSAIIKTKEKKKRKSKQVNKKYGNMQSSWVLLKGHPSRLCCSADFGALCNDEWCDHHDHDDATHSWRCWLFVAYMSVVYDHDITHSWWASVIVCGLHGLIEGDCLWLTWVSCLILMTLLILDEGGLCVTYISVVCDCDITHCWWGRIVCGLHLCRVWLWRNAGAIDVGGLCVCLCFLKVGN